MSKIIGLIGKKGSGKDTAARPLIDEHDFAHVKFAQPLKQLICDVFDIHLHYLEDPIFKEEKFIEPWTITEEDCNRFIDLIPFNFESAGQTDIIRDILEGREIETLRELMQLIGTDICRSLDPDFFTKLGSSSIDRWSSINEPVIITDIRFPNEVKEIKNRNGLIVQIVRPGEIDEDSHESENQSLKADITIINNGSIEELQTKLKEICLHGI
jgi:hypothetical protein